MKTCFLCGGLLKKEFVDVPRKVGGRLVLVKNVPAEVCMQCGEAYFGPEATLEMERLAKAESYPGEKTVTVPVREYKREA